DNMRALERPWLVAEILKDNVWDLDWTPTPEQLGRSPFPQGTVGLPYEGVTVAVEWSIRNAGRSPAFMTGIWYDLGLLPADLSLAIPPEPGPVNEMLIRVERDHATKRLLFVT